MISGTLAFQLLTANYYVDQTPWFTWVVGLFATGGIVLIMSAFNKKRAPSSLGYTLLVISILLIPGIWSGYTTFSARGNSNLPSAYGGEAIGVTHAGGLSVNKTLVEYLQSHTQNVYYLVAVSSSQTGSDYVLATGRPVLYLGGFGGQDQVVTLDELLQMIEQGELRYFLLNGGGRDPFGNGDISSWVSSSCVAIENYDVAMTNNKIGNNTNIGLGNSIFGQNGGFPQGPGSREAGNALYDCGG
ncbi:MAG: hypothetical protein JW908_07680 [Anaerolineales bacterium]|nr:hypothetical protein [Anaerolineales bacterium]